MLISPVDVVLFYSASQQRKAKESYSRTILYHQIIAPENVPDHIQTIVRPIGMSTKLILGLGALTSIPVGIACLVTADHSK